MVKGRRAFLRTALGLAGAGAAVSGYAQSVAQAPTKVGNGDAGQDLEGATPLTEGPAFAARADAVRLLERLNVSGIRGLGTLLPEVQQAPLYRAAGDVAASGAQERGTYHVSFSGQVYARTLAEPHAATRFFPVADGLAPEQLVALHIHEGLHRALPAVVREDEEAVARMTLAITAPGASHDSVRTVMDAVCPEAPTREQAGASGPRPLAVVNPSQVGYRFRNFLGPSRGIGSEARVERIHLLYSYLYPFGGDDTPFGMGLEASLLERDRDTVMGPLGVSFRLRVLSSRAFEVDLIGAAHLHSLSSTELENSSFGRDVYSAGIVLRKDFARGYIENSLVVSAGTKSQSRLGAIDYTYDYGKVVQPSVRGGFSFGAFRVGGVAELSLADRFAVSSHAFRYDSGRNRIVAAGPELRWTYEDFILTAGGKYILSATRDADFGALGNLLGDGTSDGSLDLSAAYRF